MNTIRATLETPIVQFRLLRIQPLHIINATKIAVNAVQPGLLIPGRGQDDAVRHLQLQSMAELGCRLHGLDLPVFAQDPLLRHSRSAARWKVFLPGRKPRNAAGD